MQQNNKQINKPKLNIENAYLPTKQVSKIMVLHVFNLLIDSIARDTNVVVDSIVDITGCVAPFILHLPALKLENKSVVLPNLS